MTATWAEYVGEALNKQFAQVAPMPNGATTGDYWAPVPDEPGVYFRNLEWGDAWSPDKRVVATIVGEQYSDNRPIQRHICFDCDDIDGKEKIVHVTFAAAQQLLDVLAEAIGNAR